MLADKLSFCKQRSKIRKFAWFLLEFKCSEKIFANICRNKR
jgi:hypothetical protein